MQPSLSVPALVPHLAWGIPFVGMLLTLAILPALAPRFWHRRMGLVALFWALALLVPQAFAQGPGATLHDAWHALLVDYLPFICLLVAMYVLGGAILVQGGPWGSPAGNTLLLALGTVLAGVVGPIAVAMVLIHPLLRANAHRARKVHLVVFFIALVCNVGGATTPLGNPPLYIGLLQGVPFGWPSVNLMAITWATALPLLALFWLLDLYLARSEPPAPTPPQPHMRGLANLGLLAVAMAAVILQSLWQPGELVLAGVAVGGQTLVAAGVLLGVTGLSLLVTPRAVRQANMFSWEPLAEVAKIFAAIFITITPALAMLKATFDGPLAPVLRLTADAAGQPIPAAYFWLSGLLSAVLDNAPTYLVFFNMAGADPAALTGPLERTLRAISAGSVFFGALTYIGNAPNMMVRSVAAHGGVRMPGFFGYMLWASLLLLPLFALQTWLFFL